jgi:DNA helicase-2/ATP-dependent DNA helicase PcrA
MRQRIQERVGGDSELAVGTFHALAQRWLREDGGTAGVRPGFGILSGADRWILAWRLLWKLADPALCDVEHPEHRLGGILRLLERLKQELIPLARLEAWLRRAEPGEQRDLLAASAGLFRAYGAACRRERLLDFDDLLVSAVRMLSDHQDLRERYRSRYPYVLVDEYQDTNLAQERIVELIAGEAGRVFVVGDDDQSIYRFRGASRASLERFADIYPAVKTLSLTRNRRSSAPIVAAALGLVKHNRDRVPKELTAARRRGPRVEVWSCPDAAAETAEIAAEIARLTAAGVPPSEMAVLTRTNAIAAPIARALRASDIPCRTSESWGFIDRPASKDVAAALRLIRDPEEPVPAERLCDGFGALDSRGWTALRGELQEASTRLGVADLFFELMERSRYLDGDPSLRSDAIRFGELVTAFCERARDQSLGAFIEHLELVELSGLDVELGGGGVGPEEAAEGVSVMTIHQAKGLEFEAVIVPALVDGRLPQPPRREHLELPAAILEPSIRGREDHVAEERRLAYVAMTRARTHLYLSWAAAYEGDRRWRRSPFLEEILAGAPGAVVERQVAAAPEAPPPPRRPWPGRTGEQAVYSFSSLSTYRDCPRQHWYRYRRRVPPATTSEGHLGDAVHRVLMRAGERLAQGRCVDGDTLAALLDEAWSERRFPQPLQERVYRRLAGEMLAGYLEDAGLARAPLHVELEFQVALGGLALRGVIDRIDAPVEPGGAHLVIDYKTGAALPASRLRRDFQLALYAVAAKRLLGTERIELEIAYLRERKRVRFEASDELLQEAERTAAETAAAIESGDFEPRPERRRCRACAYRLACDAAM